MLVFQVFVYVNLFYDGGKILSIFDGFVVYGWYIVNVLGMFFDVDQMVEVYNEFDYFFNIGVCGLILECYILMFDVVNVVVFQVMVVVFSFVGMGFKWDWFQQFFVQGGLDCIDVVIVYLYIQLKLVSEFGLDLDWFMLMMEDVGGVKLIWLMEMGWVMVDNWVSDEQQVVYFVQIMVILFGYDVEWVYWYEVVDQRFNFVDYEGNFGLFEFSRVFVLFVNVFKWVVVVQLVVVQMFEGCELDGKDKVVGVEFYWFIDGCDEVCVMWVVVGEKEVVIELDCVVMIIDIYGREMMLMLKFGVVSVMFGIMLVYVDGEVFVKVVKR